AVCPSYGASPFGRLGACRDPSADARLPLDILAGTLLEPDPHVVIEADVQTDGCGVTRCLEAYPRLAGCRYHPQGREARGRQDGVPEICFQHAACLPLVVPDQVIRTQLWFACGYRTSLRSCSVTSCCSRRLSARASSSGAAFVWTLMLRSKGCPS